MSKLFYTVNRETGERWEPCNDSGGWFLGEINQYLVMYDSGTLAVVSDQGYDGTSVKPLCNKTWKIVFNDSMSNKVVKSRMEN